MSTSRPFLDTSYGAYLARGVPPPDDELARVGPGTPAGEYLWRFWQPVACARDLGRAPLRIRIMGEDLVVFRDGSEHLASTDRGVIMLRKIVRDGIRAVAAGRDPREPEREPGPPIATYAQDTVLRVTPERDAEADRRLLRETGRRVVLGLPGERPC